MFHLPAVLLAAVFLAALPLAAVLLAALPLAAAPSAAFFYRCDSVSFIRLMSSFTLASTSFAP